MEWVAKCDDECLATMKEAVPKLGSELSPSSAMDLAYCAALAGAGFVSPNPMVGAVCVDSLGRFLALGSHLQVGEQHAEAHMIENIKKNRLTDQLRGATVYCTLEPCSYYGKTPSCAKALSKFPISKLVYGQVDPNKKVNGSGIEILEESGVECLRDAKFEHKTASLIRVFSWSQTSALPYVAVKFAASFNGRIGRHENGRHWVTGPRAREYGHWLRQLYDAIIVGAGTVVVDNPSLNIRSSLLVKVKNSTKVVLDPRARALTHRNLADHNLIKNCEGNDRVIWIVGKDASKNFSQELKTQLTSSPIILARLDTAGGEFRPKEVLNLLAGLGVRSVLLEGGRYLWGSFLRQGLVQRLHAFFAPIIWGVGYSLAWDSGYSDGLFPEISGKMRNSRLSPLEKDWVIEADLMWEPCK